MKIYFYCKFSCGQEVCYSIDSEDGKEKEAIRQDEKRRVEDDYPDAIRLIESIADVEDTSLLERHDLPFYLVQRSYNDPSKGYFVYDADSQINYSKILNQYDDSLYIHFPAYYYMSFTPEEAYKQDKQALGDMLAEDYAVKLICLKDHIFSLQKVDNEVIAAMEHWLSVATSVGTYDPRYRWTSIQLLPEEYELTVEELDLDKVFSRSSVMTKLPSGNWFISKR